MLNWDVLNMTFFMYLILIWKFCHICNAIYLNILAASKSIWFITGRSVTFETTIVAKVAPIRCMCFFIFELISFATTMPFDV